jgi:TonB family protein
MRTPRNIFLSLLLVVLNALALQAQQSADTTASQVAYPNTVDGLRNFLRDMRTYAARGEQDKLAAAIKQTEIPNAADWFHKTYPESANSWIGPYRKGLKQRDREMQGLLQSLATANGDFFARKVNDSPQPGKGYEWGMLQSMRQPVDIYFANWRDPQPNPSAIDKPIGYFMYIDGGFRWDSLVTFVLTMKPDKNPATLPEGAAYRVGGGVSVPKAIYHPDPQYPIAARDSNLPATVILWVIVGPDGLPHEIRVAQAAGHGFDENAIEAVQKWRFKPAKKDGQPVAVQINVQIHFKPQ